MGLNKETIIANEALANLSDEQIEAVVTLAQNSEDELFRSKMGEHYRRLDESIEEHSGIARVGDEKTYDYLPRAIDAMKGSYENTIKDLKGEIDTLKKRRQTRKFPLKRRGKVKPKRVSNGTEQGNHHR